MQYVKHSGSAGVYVRENFMATTNAIFFLQEFHLDLAEHRQELLVLVPSCLLFF